MSKELYDPRGRRIVVCGTGVTGRALARKLKALGAQVQVTDDRPRAAVAAGCAELEAEGIPVTTGGHPLAILQAADLIAVSPGLHLDQPPFTQLAPDGPPVWSEVELAYRLTRAQLIGVTGTKGKSTCAALLARLLDAPLANSEAYSPTGTPLISMVGPGEPERIVVEVTSYQLEAAYAFRPDLGILLNIAQDHADRHSSIEAYAEIKGRIFAQQTQEDIAVYWADDARVTAQASRSDGLRLGFSLQGPLPEGGWQADGGIWFRDRPDTGPVAVIGWHEVSCGLQRQGPSTLAAATAALALRSPLERVREIVRTFPSLPHRMETIAVRGGVEFINDSKATTPVATLAALRACAGRPVILIAGGDTKGNDMRPLLEPFRALKGLVLLGKGRPILRQLGEEAGVSRLAEVDNLPDAVEQAVRWAAVGDIVLLSPACSSLDMFTNFTERGEVFRREVEKR